MKKILLLFLFLYFQSNAQQIIPLKGKIVDEKTGEGLVFANILYPKKSLGFTTKPDGEFSFTLKASLKDSIVVSHLGYETISYAITDFIKLPNGLLKLKRTSVLLDEVVIASKKETADGLMKKLYKAYQKFKPKEPHIAEAYYMEKAKYNDKYVFFRESLGYSIYKGHLFHSAPYADYEFFCENTKMSDIHPDWIQKMEEISISKYNNRLSAGTNINQFNRFEYYGPLSKEHNEYDYEIDSSYVENGLHFYKIAFEGEKMKGFISFNSDNLHITEVKYETIDLYSLPFDKRLEGKIAILFNYYENVPFVSRIKTDYTYQNFSHQNDLVILSQKTKGFSLTSNEYWALNRYSIFPFIEYIPEKWSSLHLDSDIDKDYESIQKDLLINNKTLEQQFIDNSGKWINPKQAYSGEIVFLKIKELKNNF